MHQGIEEVHSSLKRCNSDSRFMEIFYEHFLGASPEIPALFEGTDMTRQRRAVEASLYLSILAADQVPYAIHTLERLGEQHRALGIRPALYGLWLESLIATVAACDEAFDEHVEAAWRAVLQESLQRVLSPYEIAE